MTLLQAERELKFIGTMTLPEYIRASREGLDFRMNRSFRKTFFNDKENIAKMIAESKVIRKQGNTLSANGMTAYNAICRDRDEVMYIDA